MKEETSRKKRMGAFTVAAMMALAVFAPVSFASAETETQTQTQNNEVDKAQGAAALGEGQAAAYQEVPAAGITVNKTSASLKAGQALKLQAAISPENTTNKSIAWSSSNTDTADVDQTGQVTAKKPGTAVITASIGSVSASCRVNVSLAAPLGVKAKASGVTVISLSWNKVVGADGYKVYRSTKKNGKYKKIATVKGGKTRFKNGKRTVGQTYYYKVRAYSGSSYSGYSAKVSGKARPVRPAIKAKSEEERVTVTWKRIGGADGYHVYRANSKKGTYKRMKAFNKSSVTNYINSNLTVGKTYYYKVRAYKKVKGKKVYSSYSAPVSSKAKKVKLKTSKKGFSYKKKFTVKAYAYSGGGRTAMGTKARVGAIAVDPKVIPLGTDVYVEGYGHARAEDTGGNIKGKKVDLYMHSTSKCYKWGVKFKTIYLGVEK